MNLAFKDWRTTVPSLISAFFAFVSWTGQTYHWPTLIVMLTGFASAGGLAFLGINARSQQQHDMDAQQMATAVQADIKNATGQKTYGAVMTAAAQGPQPTPPTPQVK